jgi:hypothetical protein
MRHGGKTWSDKTLIGLAFLRGRAVCQKKCARAGGSAAQSLLRKRGRRKKNIAQEEGGARRPGLRRAGRR